MGYIKKLFPPPFSPLFNPPDQGQSQPSPAAPTQMNAVLDQGEQERISTNLATNLIIHAEWLFPQMFSFHDILKIHELIDLRSSCKLFSRSLQPPPLYTVFPNSNNITLQNLLDHLHALHQSSSSSSKPVPSLLLIKEGEYLGEYISQKDQVTIKFPLSIRGAFLNDCFCLCHKNIYNCQS